MRCAKKPRPSNALRGPADFGTLINRCESFFHNCRHQGRKKIVHSVRGVTNAPPRRRCRVWMSVQGRAGARSCTGASRRSSQLFECGVHSSETASGSSRPLASLECVRRVRMALLIGVCVSRSAHRDMDSPAALAASNAGVQCLVHSLVSQPQLRMDACRHARGVVSDANGTCGPGSGAACLDARGAEHCAVPGVGVGFILGQCAPPRPRGQWVRLNRARRRCAQLPPDGGHRRL